MKTKISKFLLFISLLTTQFSYGNTVLRTGYAHNLIDSEAFSTYKTDVNGSSFYVGLSERVSLIEYGLMYTNGSYDGKLKHDGSDIEFKGKYSRISLDSKIFFNKHFFIQLGYGFMNSEFNLASSVSDYQKTSIYNIYNLKDKEKSSALYYGVGFDVLETKKFNVNLSINRSKIDKQKSETSAMVGLKMSFDFGSKNFLSP